MAKKELTEEQQSEIKMLLANNEMLEKTKNEVKGKGNNPKVVKQIEVAQQEVIDHIKSIDSTVLEGGLKPKTVRKKKAINQDSLFEKEESIFDILKANEEDNKEVERSAAEEKPSIVIAEDKAEEELDLTPRETETIDERTFNDVDPMAQYDVIQLPSNGECYKTKTKRIPVAYLTAYDENMITSPNLYKDGLVIDFLLKRKVVNSEIDVDDLVSGDVDAIVLFLRATSYGAEFPIVVNDPETGEQIESSIDLTTLKPREFKLVGDENGHFDFETPLRHDKVKFRYLTRKQERQLRQVTELESYGTKAAMLKREKETLTAALMNDKYVTDQEKKNVRSAIASMDAWQKRLEKVNASEYTRMMTNSLQLQVVSVNGNTDKEWIRKWIYAMPARDSLALRKYINDNRPGIDFNIEVERPQSLGGGSFKTFLNWDDSVFLNISDV